MFAEGELTLQEVKNNVIWFRVLFSGAKEVCV